MSNQAIMNEGIAKPASGTIGDNLEWNFAGGVLTVSGHGEIPAYDDYTGARAGGTARSPWYPFREKITRIVFNGGITKKSLYTFGGCENLVSISFENTPGARDILDRAMQGYRSIDPGNINSWFIEQ